MDYLIDHDIHVHTILSNCCSDEFMTKENIISHAVKKGYTSLCFTDHMWDQKVSGVSQWYSNQDVEHVKNILPIPKTKGDLKIYFGCETEYTGKDKIGISKVSYDVFDFIVVPVNHFHMVNFVRSDSITEEKDIAELFMARLEELTNLDLPWKKIGIAHLSSSTLFIEGDSENVLRYLDEKRMSLIFDFFAKEGAGIELNACCFKTDKNFGDKPSSKMYLMAKDAGCKFYCCSDGHTREKLNYENSYLADFVKFLNLKESDKYMISGV